MYSLTNKAGSLSKFDNVNLLQTKFWKVLVRRDNMHIRLERRIVAYHRFYIFAACHIAELYITAMQMRTIFHATPNTTGASVFEAIMNQKAVFGDRVVSFRRASVFLNPGGPGIPKKLFKGRVQASSRPKFFFHNPSNPHRNKSKCEKSYVAFLKSDSSPTEQAAPFSRKT